MRNLFRNLAAGIVAFSLVAPAFADPPRHSNGRGNDREYRDNHRSERRSDDRGRNDNRYDNRRDDRRSDYGRNGRRNDYAYYDQRRGDRYQPAYRYAPPRYVAPRYAAPRYAAPVYVAPRRSYWRAGAYLPRQTRYVVVNDYYRYGLSPPRHGHYYADVDGDILLVAAATGLIVWALNN